MVYQAIFYLSMVNCIVVSMCTVPGPFIHVTYFIGFFSRETQRWEASR